MQRKTICDLKSSGQLLDTDAILGKVFQKSGMGTYQTKDKMKKPFFYLVVADETASIKVMVYGNKLYEEIMEDRSYLFRRIKIDEIGVKVNALSKVSETTTVEVPAEIEMEAQNLICSDRPVCSITEVNECADGTVVSVEGTATEVSFSWTTLLDTWIHICIETIETLSLMQKTLLWTDFFLTTTYLISLLLPLPPMLFYHLLHSAQTFRY